MFYYYNVIFLNFMELRRKCGIVYIIWGKKLIFFLSYEKFVMFYVIYLCLSDEKYLLIFCLRIFL